MIVPAPRNLISRGAPRDHIARHRHNAGYAALILSGGYMEAGDTGRYTVRAGDVLLHDSFEAHQDIFGTRSTILVNLPLVKSPGFSRGYVDDADAIARMAERDSSKAASLLLRKVTRDDSAEQDWPDRLAADLRANRVSDLAGWAARHGLRPGSVSRGFALAYGVSPQRYRVEARAQRAMRLIRDSRASLARIASDSGFSDQPHMTRAIRSVTGVTPAALRSCPA